MRFAPVGVPATIALLLLATAVAPQQPAQQSSGRPATSAPPVAAILPRIDTVLGDVRVDNYFWLRDDTRKNPDVIAYLQAETRIPRRCSHTRPPSRKSSTRK